MGQEEIKAIIVELKGEFITANAIYARLCARAIKEEEDPIGLQSIYASLKKVEKDDDIEVTTKPFIKFRNGREMKFNRKVWKYRLKQ